jgi:hypothetical protein
VKFSRSIELLCSADTDIRERDRVKFRSGTYEAKGVTVYRNIRKAVCELI